MMNVLLISSLEGSWQVAEAMEARGFGQGKRTSYTRERWARRDLLAWVAMVISLGLMAWMSAMDMVSYRFYPQLDDVGAGGAVALVGMVVLHLLLLLPPVLMKRRRR